MILADLTEADIGRNILIILEPLYDNDGELVCEGEEFEATVVGFDSSRPYAGRGVTLAEGGPEFTFWSDHYKTDYLD